MRRIIQFVIVFGFCAAFGIHPMHAQVSNATGRTVQYTGVNIAGGEFYREEPTGLICLRLQLP